MSSDPQALSAVAVLADDLRRRMHEFIRRADGPVTRDEAAAAVGISRKLAAFHLDKLVDAGLLEAGFARPAGLRRAGRASKVYAPADVDVQVSIPPRDHAVLADILVGAVTVAEDARRAALRVADERGHELGSAERARLRPGRLGTERALTLACETLERFGFEPARAEPTRVFLRNCPFQPLAAQRAGPGLRGQPGVPGRIPARARRVDRDGGADPAARRLLRGAARRRYQLASG